MVSEICSGIRVLDLSRSWSGALVTMVLADAGAEVIKIEAPGGDPTWNHYASPMWHRGKKSAFLDLKSVDGQEFLTKLVAKSDVLVHTFMPGTDTKLGADYDTLSPYNQSLVYCSISGFGPLKHLEHIKGYDAIVAALTGRFYSFQKQIDREGPKFSALPVASFGAAMLALQGIMSGLFSKERTGLGQKVETSLLQSLAIYDWEWLVTQMKRRGINPKEGWPDTQPTPQYFVSRTKDGKWLQMANAMEHLFANWLIGIGLEDVLGNPKYSRLPFVELKEDEEVLYSRMFSRMEEKTIDEWTYLFMTEVDAASEPFLHTEEAFTHPQIVYNAHSMLIETPGLGMTRQIGPLARFDKTPLEVDKPAPVPGVNTQEILDLAKNAKMRVQRIQKKGIPTRPLEGVTIVDLASWIAVPLAPAMLADLGARVIRIEPLGGEPWRGWGYVGLRTHQSKESVALNLKDPKGQQIAHQIIKKADILVHNMRPGVPIRLAIDYPTVKKINPGIIYLYGAGYGSTGPYSHRSAMHPVPGAVAGGALYQAGLGTPPSADSTLNYQEVRKVAHGLSVANDGNPDITSSLVVADVLLMALYSKEKTGKGQYLETTMLGSGLYAASDDFIQYDGKPKRLLPDPDLYGLHALYRSYQVKDGWIFLACGTESEWKQLCMEIGRNDLSADDRFSNRESRITNNQALSTILEEFFSDKCAVEQQDTLNSKGVACAVIRPDDFSDFATSDATMRESGLMIETEHPSLGKYLRYGSLVNFSLTSEANLGPVTYVGEHTAKVLEEIGYSQEQLESFHKSKIAFCHQLD